MLIPSWSDSPEYDNERWQRYLEEECREREEVNNWEDIYLDDYRESEGYYAER